MTVGVVTGFEHNGREYEVPTSTDERKQFTNELTRELESLDGVTTVYNAGTTTSWDNVRLEIELEFTDRHGQSRLVPAPRSLSPRLRNTISEFTPVSAQSVVHTPTPVDADEGLYHDAYYIIEVWFY